MIGAPLIQYLLGLPAISAAVGGGVLPVMAPQGTEPPYLVVEQTAGKHEITMGGMLGLAESTYDVTAWSSSYASAEQLAIVALQGVAGVGGELGRCCDKQGGGGGREGRVFRGAGG